MKISTFKLERFFAAHEFNVKYTLTNSDCEPMSLAELLQLADDESRESVGEPETRIHGVPGRTRASPGDRAAILRLHGGRRADRRARGVHLHCDAVACSRTATT